MRGAAWCIGVAIFLLAPASAHHLEPLETDDLAANVAVPYFFNATSSTAALRFTANLSVDLFLFEPTQLATYKALLKSGRDGPLAAAAAFYGVTHLEETLQVENGKHYLIVVDNTWHPWGNPVSPRGRTPVAFTMRIESLHEPAPTLTGFVSVALLKAPAAEVPFLPALALGPLAIWCFLLALLCEPFAAHGGRRWLAGGLLLVGTAAAAYAQDRTGWAGWEWLPALLAAALPLAVLRSRPRSLIFTSMATAVWATFLGDLAMEYLLNRPAVVHDFQYDGLLTVFGPYGTALPLAPLAATLVAGCAAAVLAQRRLAVRVDVEGSAARRLVKVTVRNSGWWPVYGILVTSSGFRGSPFLAQSSAAAVGQLPPGGEFQTDIVVDNPSPGFQLLVGVSGLRVRSSVALVAEDG
ncbi:MAG: hypothetical protein ABR586_09685 [Thermoplasmatota archaeon]